MTKLIPIFFSGAARVAVTIGLCVFSFHTYAEESLQISEPVPSCVNVCYEEKSGKARRGCASICQAQENSCVTSGGSFEFQSDQYVCSSSRNIGVAKQ